ncbi:hypothetical protein VNO80_18528 [Phaseolus coccineus]|uniref:Uncharacterized protein n=1 Tax=Phaseolus coccineus TaxID=3886 RepID=A0AAN9MJJ5_PHACN
MDANSIPNPRASRFSSACSPIHCHLFLVRQNLRCPSRSSQTELLLLVHDRLKFSSSVFAMTFLLLRSCLDSSSSLRCVKWFLAQVELISIFELG